MTQVALWKGVLFAGAVYLISVILHLVLPGRRFEGYVCCDDPKRDTNVLQYKLNGMLVRCVMLIGIVPLVHGLEYYSSTSSQSWIEMIATAYAKVHTLALGAALGGTVWGLLLSMFLLRRGHSWCLKHKNERNGTELIRARTNDPMSKSINNNNRRARPPFNSWLALYQGIGEFNPRSKILGQELDWKMWLYLGGAIMLDLQVLSALGAHMQTNNYQVSNVMAWTSLGWFLFVTDYLSNEHVHLYTYDLFAERLGFKLVWGCLQVYPFLYPIGQYPLVGALPDDDLSVPVTVAFALLYILGSILTRGANYQKYVFKVNPTQTHICFGLVPQKTMEMKNGRALLVSGWWALARHVNYLGEILQGVALGVPAFWVTGSVVTLVYPLFITSILLQRQYEDDRMCRLKYGNDAWDAYIQRVPYKIVPLVY